MGCPACPYSSGGCSLGCLMSPHSSGGRWVHFGVPRVPPQIRWDVGALWGAPCPSIAQAGALWGAPCPRQPLRSPTPYLGSPPGPPTPRGADRCSLGYPVPPSPSIPCFLSPCSRVSTARGGRGKSGGGQRLGPPERAGVGTGGASPPCLRVPCVPCVRPPCPPPGRAGVTGLAPSLTPPLMGCQPSPPLSPAPYLGSPRRCHLRVPKHAGGSAGGVPAPPPPRPLQYTLGPSEFPGGWGDLWGHPGGLHPRGQRGGDGSWEWGALGVSRDVQIPLP